MKSLLPGPSAAALLSAPHLLAQHQVLLLQQQQAAAAHQAQMLQYMQAPPGAASAPPPGALLAPPLPPPQPQAPPLPLPASIGGIPLLPPAAGAGLASALARLGGGGGGGGAAAPPMATKAFRELFVGNLPEGVNAAMMRDFFNAVMAQLKLGRGDLPGVPVLSFRTSADASAKFGFLEFRTPEDCDAALTLNGVQFNTNALKLVRPKGYVPPPGSAAAAGAGAPPPVDLAALAPYAGPAGAAAGAAATAAAAAPPSAAVLASMGLGGGSLFGGAALAPPPPPPVAPGEGAHVMHASNLFNSAAAVEGLRTMLAGFGSLRDFVKLPAGEAGGTAGVLAAFSLPPGGLPALRERVDGALSLSGTPFLGGLPLKLQRASEALVAAHLPAHAAAGPEPTPVLELSNIVVVGEIDFDSAADMEELTADVRTECGKTAPVVRVLVPRADGAPGVSVPMYVAFEAAAGAAACAAAMRTKKFAERLVGTRFVQSEEWAKLLQSSEGAA
jgi:splicing factor U2AF subunit